MIFTVFSMLDVGLLFAPLLLLVMLMPAVFELRKPKDAGPRLIMPNSSHAAFPLMPVSGGPLFDIEEPHNLDVRLKPFISHIFGDLQNIDV